jgi:hypothetical protein
MVIRGLTSLISNVANDIPELKKYFFATNWQWAICDFLECNFSRWAEPPNSNNAKCRKYKHYKYNRTSRGKNPPPDPFPIRGGKKDK